VRLDEGLAQLERAIELDPGFAAAHPMIAINEKLADLTFQRCNSRIVGLTGQSLPILIVCRILRRSVPILPSFC
jgi:hypothetical protein